MVPFSFTAHGLAVMSIDLGSESLKIAIVSPGKPMEIILNTDSQRKTPLAVAFRDGDRLFGEAALTTVNLIKCAFIIVLCCTISWNMHHLDDYSFSTER